jgi:hypothetical protein
MRPLSVQPNTNAVLHRTYVQSVDF